MRFSVLVMLLAAGCATSTTEREGLPPLTTVPSLDLDRYMGTWFELASFPQSFQAGCTATTATYTKQSDGTIEVKNECRLGSPAGESKVALGRARAGDSPAKLQVSFFGPFWADYWVIGLADDYSWAVVGHPSRDYLWILSRTPALDDATYARIVSDIAARGYDTIKLVKTEH